jgi:hypothetical protein
MLPLGIVIRGGPRVEINYAKAYYNTPALWSLSMAHWGGMPTAETKSLALLEMTMSRSSLRLPPV